MKIVNLDEFLTMPSGTVFTFYNQFEAEPTMVKSDTVDGSFYYSHTGFLDDEFGYDNSPGEFEVWEQPEVDALLARLQKWQPIETAPKDGTRILCRDKDGDIDIAKWRTDIGWATHYCDCGGSYGYANTINAIEWMPLPI